MGGMANLCERSINIVTDNKPKMLRGLSQNGNVAGTRTLVFLVMGTQRYRWRERKAGPRHNLTHLFVIAAEHGNPVYLPQGKASREASLWMCGHERMEQAKATL